MSALQITRDEFERRERALDRDGAARDEVARAYDEAIAAVQRLTLLADRHCPHICGDVDPDLVDALHSITNSQGNVMPVLDTGLELAGRALGSREA